MSDTRTSCEQVAEGLRAEFRDLVRTWVLPLVDAAERDQRFPVEIYRWLGEWGLLSIGAPADQGGQDGGRTSEVMVVEELTSAGAGITMSVVPFFIVRIAIWEFGTRQAIDEVGKPMIRGERIVGICMSEPGAGSDVASISTRAERVAGGWRISGSKMFITNGTIATDLLVVAKTRRDDGTDGVGLFLLETAQPGYTARKLDKEASRASDTTEIHFDRCFVPDYRVVGSPVDGFRQAMRVLNGERILSAARAIRLAHDAWHDVERWATDMSYLDGSALGYQIYQGPLAATAGELWLLRLALRQCCHLWDEGEPAVEEISMLKTLSSTMSVSITRRLERLVGAPAVLAGNRIGRNARDARLGTVAAGSEQIMHRIIARQRGWPVAPH